VESAYDRGADMIATPCPLCQTNVEIYQVQINKRYGTNNMPVVYYSQLMTLAYGGSARESGLDCQLISARKPEEIAIKVASK
jgi:heterodisulfide reductase subunit B